MKQMYSRLLVAAGLAGVFLFSSCRSHRQVVPRYEVEAVSGSMIVMDAKWDADPDAAAVAVLQPYKERIDAMMYEVIGVSEQTMDKGGPESLLSNLVASVLQEEATPLLGKPADMGLINMGGLRNILPQGEITVGTVYEILPFENTFCLLSLRGRELKELLRAVASLQGEGVSGVRLEISSKGELLSALVGGRPVEDDRLYTVATVDYLADGNGGMEAFLRAEKRECPENRTLREVFLQYVRRQTAAGKHISSQLDGRITVK